MAFKIGQTVGGYEFIGVLDTLGLGVGYKVLNLSRNRLECLKVLPQDLNGSRQGEDRFQREIRIHSRLNHPNLASFYGASEIEGQLAITTEFLDGTSLERRLEQGRIPLAEGIGYVCQALAGLGCAHGHGVIHRCIAPANLVILRDGTVKVTGFGFAKTAVDPRLTALGFVIGIADYVSPEQVKQIPLLDPRADIYSMSAVLYEVATGKPPFSPPGIFETLQAHLNISPAPPSKINPNVTAKLDRIILKGLAKEPSQRYRTADALREELEGVSQALKRQEAGLKA